MSEPLLQLRGVSKSFGSVQALSDVSFDIHEGEIHALCGENGAGKSTLMKILSGVYPHGSFEGTITMAGTEVNFANVRDSERAGVAIIHQELALCPNLSIAENIFLGHERSQRGVVSPERTNADAVQMMRRVGLAENPGTLVGHLGVGKQQLVEIAKALTRDARVLLLDEPTAALNDADATHLLELVANLRSRGVTCVLITHKLNEIRAAADNVTILRDGRAIETLSMADPATDDARIIRSMVGRPLDSLYPDRPTRIGPERLKVSGWTVEHPSDKGRLVVNDASFTVRAGEVVGFAGLIGSGRTELAMSIFGRSYGRYRGGELHLDGEPVAVTSVTEAIKHKLAYVSEDRKSAGLNVIATIAANVSAATTRGVARWGVVDPARESAVADDYRRSMRIRTRSVTTPVDHLSGGNQQKVSLAKWLRTAPDVLFLDEPTRGIDVGAKSEIYQIISQLADEGRAVVLISSELPELLGLCHRIYTVREGRITHEVDAASASQELLMHHMTKRSTEATNVA